ncbi:hypothetical protein EB796_022977 [Bugula neritina]|uniref:Uncharacterized protein n=1 Tax=Bugula neritina TaxID=10212 RepID=A0A7J7IZ94_BUGNE|nr:hypothetical protein EB796_022977 [Bugula neritina]
MTAAQMREALAKNKKPDPRKDKSIATKDKLKMFQNLWWRIVEATKMMAAVKYLFMLTALCWYCCTLIEAGVIENCLSKCVAGVDAKDVQSSWAKIVCNARCGDLYPESGFQPSYTFQDSAGAASSGPIDKRKWSWVWDDSETEEEKQAWEDYKKRYVDGKDKFLHFG